MMKQASIINAILAAGAALLLSPLAIHAQLSPPPELAREPAGVPTVIVDPGGEIVFQVRVAYPPDAVRRRLEGVVGIQLTLNSRGEVIDAAIFAEPMEFRRAVLQSALQWRYAPTGARTAIARVDFRFVPEAR